MKSNVFQGLRVDLVIAMNSEVQGQLVSCVKCGAPLLCFMSKLMGPDCVEKVLR